MCIGCTKTVIQHNLQLVYISSYSVFSPLHAYFFPIHGNGELPVIGKLPYIK
jgi:hypothetical protein